MVTTNAIVMVDTDGVSPSGAAIGLEVGVVDALTGKLQSSIEVTRGAVPVASNALQAITYADVQFNDDQRLYAILNIAGASILGELDPVTGVFTDIADVTALSGIPISSMAVGLFASSYDASLGALFITNTAGELFELSYTAAAGVITSVDTVIFDLRGAMRDIDNQLMSNASIFFDRSGRMLAHDKYNGRLVDVDWQSGDGVTVDVGMTVATADGSVRPTVGAMISTQIIEAEEIGGDPNNLLVTSVTDTTLAVDNAPSLGTLSDEGFAEESAWLMTLTGTSNDSPTGQDIGKILVGGKLTGRVSLSGSVDTFYAGALLTGQSAGQGFGAAELAGNFSVAGDLRNLIVSDSIGSNGGGVYVPNYAGRYYTGFDLVVGGQVGQIRVLQDFAGSLTVNNNSSVTGYPAGLLPQNELELYSAYDDPAQMESDVFNLISAEGLFAADGRFYNDTFATAQRLGTLRTGVSGQPDFIRVAGMF
ncbi:MAG: hypothetical protein HC901_01785, partial [Bdellovibrionaceae bacterium]|nr:hypothetical protein [Pseudobdellovibrionaceae bacterium]